MNKGTNLALSPRASWRKSVSKKGFQLIFGRDWKVAFPFVLPLVLIMGGLILWPFINAIMISMTTRSLVTREETFVGFANYERLLSDSDYIRSVQNTIVFTVASVAIKFVTGICIA